MELEGQDAADRQGFKRKKKRSYLQRAKRFGKSGRFGKGRDIDKDTYDYFLRVMENLRDGQFEDEESQILFVENVFAQTEGEEVKLCGNQLASRVLQDLLPDSSPEVRIRFMRALSEDLRVTAADPFASHILECLLTMAVFAETKTKSNKECLFEKEWCYRVCGFSVNNFSEFVNHPYASHVLRTTLQCLAGRRMSEDVLRSRRFRTQSGFGSNTQQNKKLHTLRSNFDPDQESVKLLEDAAKRTCELMEEDSDALSSDAASGVVQVLMACLAKASQKQFKKVAKVLVSRLAGDCDDEGVQAIMECEAYARLIESIICHCKNFPKLLASLSKQMFEGRLIKWSQHPVGNFTVQRLIDSCSDKEKFEGWYEKELDANLEDILAAGSTGVVLSIAKACRRLSAKQAHFLVSLMKSLHCYEPSQRQTQLCLLLSRLVTRETVEEKGADEFSIHIHGSLMLQELLAFNKPIKVVTSLLSLQSPDLSKLLSDPCGSHITDAFMASTTIGEKSREGLVKGLKGELVSMCCSKHGSRSVSSIWRNGSLKVRESLASDLAPHKSRLASDQFGHHSVRDMGLTAFRRSRDDWRRSVEGVDKKKELMKDFLVEDMKIGKKTKKVVKEEEEGVKWEAELPLETAEPKKKRKKREKPAKSYLDDL